MQAQLKLAHSDAQRCLDRLEQLLMRFSRAMLSEHATFDVDGLGFDLRSIPRHFTDAGEHIALGRYELPRRSDEAHIYRLQHPLAQGILHSALNAPLPHTGLVLDYQAYGAQVAALRALQGERGNVVVQCLTVRSLGATEEFLLMAATAGTQVLDAELTDKLLALPGTAMASATVPMTPADDSALQSALTDQERQVLRGSDAGWPRDAGGNRGVRGAW